MNKRFQKLGRELAIGCAIFAAYATSCHFIQENNHKNIPSYIQKNLTQIVKTQEEKLHIQHFGIPKIVYDYPDWHGPKLLLGLAEIHGEYTPEKDRIFINTYFATTSEVNLSNILSLAITLGTAHSAKETIDHELGHYYADKLHEHLWNENWPAPTLKDDKNAIGIALISEGIAEYFNRTVNDNSQDTFQDTDWPKEKQKFWKRDILYEGGYHLVKPVIDLYGRKGIAYLMKHVPSSSDLHNLPNYKKTLLQALSSEQ